MKEKLYDYEIPTNSDDKVVYNWAPLDTQIDGNYKFERNNIFYKAFSFIFRKIATIVLLIINSFVFGLKIKGLKNLRKIKGGVVVANHVHILDNTMILATFNMLFKRTYILAEKEAFDIPIVRRLIPLLGAIPIPNNLDGKRAAYKYVDKLLTKNKFIVIFPESSLWPYYEEVRPFKQGAFKFALKANKPIIPICISFRPSKGLLKLHGKVSVNLEILKPIYPKEEYDEFENRKYLEEESHKAISSKYKI